MNARHPFVGTGLLIALLAGCSASQPGPESTPSVAITTIKPVQRTFHNSIAAWGEAAANSNALQRLSMAHGGLVSELPVTAGQSVHAGQALLRMTTDPAALSAFRQARSALKLARSDLARTRGMLSRHLATQSQLAAAQKSVDDAVAAMQAQREIGAGQATHTLKAPADGVVTALHVGRGDRVAANAPLLDFTPSSGLVAQLGVQPDQADAIHTGMPAQIEAVYGDHGSAMGHVDMLGRSVDPNTHLVPVRVVIPAGMDARLIAGSPLKARIRIADFTAWAVPRDAVLGDAKGHYLFQELKGLAHRVDVKVLQPDGATLGVSGTLQANLPVIVTGAYELSDGDAVRESSK